jgi:hypothetical protein
MRPAAEGQVSTADTPNRKRDKEKLEREWMLPEFGTQTLVRFETTDGTVLAVGYTSVLYGDHGPYVEFDKEHIRFDNWVLNTVKQHPNRFYDEWFADGGRVLLYDKLQTVHGQSCPPAGLSSVTNLRPEGYAAYKVGKCYLELSEFTVLKEGAPTSQ